MSLESTNFPKFIADFRKASDELTNHVKEMADFIQRDSDAGKKGISLLNVKNVAMFDYLSALNYLALKKMDKKSIAGDSAIGRLIELRTILERRRVIEQKMQYQIDKLMKLINSTGEGKDALSYRPNPKALVANKDEDESDGSEGADEADDEERKGKTKKYVPPKLMAMPYNEDGERVNKSVEKAKKRALSSSLVRDLQEQYGHGPEEIMDVESGKKRDAESRKERTNYEEENFVRLQMSRAQKKAEKRVSAKSTLQSLLDFGDYHVDDESEPKKQKRSLGKAKSRGKAKGKGKGKRK